jgi:LysM repeat protein
MIAPMAARSPARFLAPLALLGFVLALALIVSQSSPDGGTSTRSGTDTTQESPAATPAATSGGDSASSDSKGPRVYRVKVGDTPSAIAEKTGVPLSQIQELNPDLDPQTLAPGQRIKLRK